MHTKIVNFMCDIIICIPIDKEITGGEIDVTAKLFGIPVLNTKYNVCDVVSGGCPFQGELYIPMLILYLLC